MGFSILIIFLGLATLTIQKSVKLMDTQESPELEVILENLLNQGLYKDVKLKINPNKKSRAKDVSELQYIGEISSENDGKEGLKSLNKKLANLLDGLQDSVMNENTNNPKCSCGYASKRWPGVVKCQCDSLSYDNDAPNHAKDILESMHEIHSVDDNSPVKTKKNEKLQERRKIRAVKAGQDKNIARFTKDNDINLWSEGNGCGCTRLSDAGDDDNDELTLRCGCNSPARLGKVDDRENGYWTESTEGCGCTLLRNRGNGIKDLRCRCNSPARLGKDDDKENGYWTESTEGCGCTLLRNRGNGIKDLRCRCNSPARLGKDDDKENGYWTESTEGCGCTLLRNRGNGIKDLRCRCNSPARLGKDDDREDNYWTDSTEGCGCNVIRNGGNGIKDLRCRCNSPSRAGLDMYSVQNEYNPRSDHYSAILSDISEEDNNYRNKNPKTKSDERNLNILMGLILDEDENLDLAQLPDKDRKVLLKLKDLMPSLRNIDIEELKHNIETTLKEKQYPLRETVFKHKKDKANPFDNLAQIQRLLQLIEEQKTQKKNMYRRSSPEEAVGVPFTYEIEGLAQINT